MKNYALIVAGGSGSRMNSEIPKQFILLNNLPILMHSINRFTAFDHDIEIVVVLPKSQFPYWKQLCKTHNFTTPHLLIEGGETRFQSVKKGLAAIDDDGLVAIHDGVRPLVNRATINRCFETASKTGNAIPVMPVVESLRLVTPTDNKAVDRSQFVTIQTPQVFSISEIKAAYGQSFQPTFTDDATVLESTGKKIHLVEGNSENIKVTHPLDLKIAEVLIKQPL